MQCIAKLIYIHLACSICSPSPSFDTKSCSRSYPHTYILFLSFSHKRIDYIYMHIYMHAKRASYGLGPCLMCGICEYNEIHLHAAILVLRLARCLSRGTRCLSMAQPPQPPLYFPADPRSRALANINKPQTPRLPFIEDEQHVPMHPRGGLRDFRDWYNVRQPLHLVLDRV